MYLKDIDTPEKIDFSYLEKVIKATDPNSILQKEMLQFLQELPNFTQDNWDDEGAKAVQMETALNAIHFLRYLSVWIRKELNQNLPSHLDIYGNKSGGINISWKIEKVDFILLIKISKDGQMIYSGNFKKFEIKAGPIESSMFNEIDEIKNDFLNLFKKIYHLED